MPSIILVSVDCLRADHLSAYGYPRETSPHIDAFSREAVLFETAVAASTYTLPTQASMLTGLPPSLHGANLRRGISPSVAYVPESLLRAGYRVSAVVSAAFLSQAYGFHRGFHSYRVNGGRAASIIDHALAVLDEGEGQAQFLFLHLYDVHAPYTAPTEFIDRFLEPEADVTESLRVMTPNARAPNDGELQRVIALYDAEIVYVDQEIGRFLDELKARGLFDTSLIIITADHGEAFQEHGAWRHGRALALDKPGLYDEIVHIPLIVKWPGETTGVEIASVVSQMDVSATILEAAGIESSSAWSLGLRRHIDGGGNVSTRHVIAEAVTRDPKRGARLQIALRDERSQYIVSFRAITLSELSRHLTLRQVPSRRSSTICEAIHSSSTTFKPTPDTVPARFVPRSKVTSSSYENRLPSMGKTSHLTRSFWKSCALSAIWTLETAGPALRGMHTTG